MSMKKEIADAIFDAVEEINKQLPEQQRLERTLSASLLSNSGVLDSLHLVTLIVTIEQKLESRAGITISLTDELFMSQPYISLETVESLVNHVYSLACGEAVEGRLLQSPSIAGENL